MPAHSTDTQTEQLTPAEVRRLCGDILDWKVEAIVATRGTAADLEIALAWAEGIDSPMLDAEHPLAGAASQIHDLLIADEEYGEEQ